MLKRAHEKGVEKIICIGTSHEDSLVARDFASSHENVYWTYGIHPEECSRMGISEMAPLGPRPAGPSGETELPRSDNRTSSVVSRLVVPSPRAAGARPRAAALRIPSSEPFSDITVPEYPIAIGEVGLDYHYEGYERVAQIKLFEEMLQLAIDNDLPVSFHVREAFDDFFAVTSNFPAVRGVVHSFTDSKKVLKRILNETDFYVGINGLATYTTLPTPPLERILLETDAPFLTPIPFRGIINESAYIYDIAMWLSGKLGVDFKIIEKETTKNAERLFDI